MTAGTLKKHESEPKPTELAIKTEPLDTILQKVNVVGLQGLGDIDQMRQKLEENIKRREMIYELIEKYFIKGVDYGPADNRNPKDTLLKPGAEKVCVWFNTHPNWRVDKDTWEMLGRPENTVCYICEITDNESGRIIGTGRGSETVGNKQRDTNKAIKNAEKCSIVDAALWTFCLSERFTQDNIEIQNVNSLKKSLVEMVMKKRSGIPSELTDNNFVIKVCQNVIHKKMMSTRNEVNMVFKAIEDNQYDFATGEKPKDQK